MKRNALLTFACCLVMGIAALIATPSPAMAMPYHATDSELVGTAYAVLNPVTGELDFVRSTETHADGDTGTVKSISGGTYTGTIYTGFENLSGYKYPGWYTVRKSVKSVRFVDAVRPISTFCWCSMSNCTEMNLSKLDTSQVKSMYEMFNDCRALTSLNLSSFDTSQVTDMGRMFGSCYSLTSLDLSSFDTSRVMNMSWMFWHCESLTSLDISNFDTSKVTNMGQMFFYCKSLTSLDVSHFDTSKVTDMGGMFNGCKALASLDVSSFDTSQVTDMDYMFNGCTSLNKITFGDRFVIN